MHTLFFVFCWFFLQLLIRYLNYENAGSCNNMRGDGSIYTILY